MTVTDTPTTNELVLARVDEALKGCTRNLIPIEEFTDTLLDIRSLVTTPETR